MEFSETWVVCVKLALARFYNLEKQRINVLKKLPVDVICKRFLYLKRSWVFRKGTNRKYVYLHNNILFHMMFLIDHLVSNSFMHPLIGF